MSQNAADRAAEPGKLGSPWLLGSGIIVAAIAAIKLLIHLYASGHYGYFVDELYYIACSKDLDFGYVDQPPLISRDGHVQAKTAIFGRNYGQAGAIDLFGPR